MRLLFIILLIPFFSHSQGIRGVIGQHKVIRGAQPVVYVPRQVSFDNYYLTQVFGDSRTDSAFTANGVSYNWIEMLKDSTGIKTWNNALQGNGVSLLVQKLFDNADTARSDEPIIVLTGFNNARYLGYTDRLMNKYKNSFRAVLVNNFLDTMEYAGNLTTAGLWSSLTHSMGVHSKSYYSSGGVRKGAYTTYTYSVNGSQLTWNFSGTNVVVGAIGQDTTNKQSYEAVLGRWQVLIDDVVVDTIRPYEQTEGLRPNYEADQIYYTYIKIYSGLTNTSHTLKLRPMDVSVPKYMDFVGTLRSPSLVPPVVFLKETYQTASGYLADASFDQGNNAYIDSVNSAIYSAMQDLAAVDTAYWSKMTLLPTMSYFDTSSHYGADQIHWNASGNTAIYNLNNDYIDWWYPVPQSVSNSSVTSSGATVSWSAPVHVPAYGYNVQIRKVSDESLAAEYTLTGTSQAVTGLTGSTQYRADVRSYFKKNPNTYSSFASTTFTTSASGPLARFNFNATAQSVSGWTDVSGEPHTGVRSATSGGITVSSLTTSEWNPFSISAHNTNGEAGGTYFNSTVMQSFWVNYSFTWASSADNNMRISGLTPGQTYTLKISGSWNTAVSGALDGTNTCIRVNNGSCNEFGANDNTANGIQVTGTADGSGYIYLWIGSGTGGNGGFISGMEIYLGTI